MSSEIKVDTISENTSANGVAIDSVTLKDGTVDVNGTADGIILDADADTTISADTDDQIDIKIAGADDIKITANKFELLSGTSLDMDGISTSAAAGDISFYANTQASQSIGNNSLTKMTFAEGFDRGGNYASDKFTAPKAGVYHFVANARIDGVAVNRFITALYKNGSSLDGNAVHLTSEQQQTNGYYITVISHNLLSLAADDYIEAYIYQNTGSSADVFQKGFFGYRVGTAS